MDATSKIPQTAVNLLKVKLDPKGGLSANYEVTVTQCGEPTIIERTENNSSDIHPDLRDAIARLREFVVDAFAFPKELAEKIEIRGVAWSGGGDGAGVVITSVLEAVNGQKTALNTPRIKLSAESFGFEPDLEDAANSIKEEVYKYLFEGKRAQLSLFGDPVNPEEGDEEKAMA